MTFATGPSLSSQQRVGGPKRFVLWETKTRFYLVAFNVSQTKFRILKVDRTSHAPLASPDPSSSRHSSTTNGSLADSRADGPGTHSGFSSASGPAKPQVDWELSVIPDRTIYTRAQVIDLLTMIREGNKSTGGLKEVGRFFGVVGFIRFTSTYYMVLISRRSVVALLGGHYIYHCDETRIIPVSHPSVISSLPGRTKALDAEEARLLATFRQVDLSKNFYFSYSLDLTRTLQDNLTALPEHSSSEEPSDPRAHPETASANAWGYNEKFIWNHHLLLPAFKETINSSADADGNGWVLPLIYGFVDQAKLSILNRTVYVTLIARRSRHFAGARFLKRGVDANGHVANDVETEQIVNEALTTPFYAPKRKKFGTAGSSSVLGRDSAEDQQHEDGAGGGSIAEAFTNHADDAAHEGEREERLRYEPSPRFTAYVMYRGSIPVYWTQDSTNLSPRPPIEISVVDPYYSAAALHFDDLFRRYGAPVIVLNLVKCKEKVPREMKLLHHFQECTNYLNQFLPKDKQIKHIAWDMSRASKSHDQDVIRVLEDIAEETIATTKFFHSGPELSNPDDDGDDHSKRRDTILLQNGVARVCCVDCLDRTNAAQFVIGKAAFGHQLHALGLVVQPSLPFDSDAVNMLTEMYHDLGDTIALQYGGSHLVNTMETYRKINQWSSHSRDMLEGLKRYYANSFADADKQAAINLFLGVTELDSAHEYAPAASHVGSRKRRHYQQWFTPQYLEERGSLEERTKRLEAVVNDDGDFWAEYYRPGLFTDLERHHAYKMTAVPHQDAALRPEQRVAHSVFSAPGSLGASRRRNSAQTKSSRLSTATGQKESGAGEVEKDAGGVPQSAQALALTTLTNKNLKPEISQDELREYGWYTRQFMDAGLHMHTGLEEPTRRSIGFATGTQLPKAGGLGSSITTNVNQAAGGGGGGGRSKYRHIADDDAALYNIHIAIGAGEFSVLTVAMAQKDGRGTHGAGANEGQRGAGGGSGASKRASLISTGRTGPGRQLGASALTTTTTTTGGNSAQHRQRHSLVGTGLGMEAAALDKATMSVYEAAVAAAAPDRKLLSAPERSAPEAKMKMYTAWLDGPGTAS
ncbi:phosphatidylinositol-3,5-bisphosphate 5-phosphatase [Tilletia horrida]|nr:phosphatidylinositol-3,5-bisphosphate 5-phosphatase [Tilletia horrida]